MPTSSDIEGRRAGIIGIGRLVVPFEDFASEDTALIVLISVKKLPEWETRSTL